MDARDDGEVSKPSLGDPRLRQATAPISSLNEAWLYALDKCAIGTPLSETILPLMRNCFFGGRCTRSYCCRRVMAISWLPILPASLWKNRSRDIQSRPRAGLIWG